MTGDDRGDGRRGATMCATMPLAIAGAITMGLTGQLAPASASAAPHLPREKAPQSPGVLPAALAVTAIEPAPGSYTVVAGDSVASIAERYGLSTPAVLALNGLSWSSLIHPGQVLRLTGAPETPPTAAPTTDQATQPMPSQHCTVTRGDTVSGIAARYGVATAAVLGANGLSWSSIIYPGQTLVIPGSAGATSSPVPSSPMQRASSVTPATPPATAATPTTPTTTWTVRHGDTVFAIAKRSGVTTAAVLAANGLSGTAVIYPGQVLTIPAASAGASASAVASVASASPASLPGLDATQSANARTIVAVGRELGVPDRGIVIALAAAAQESTMRNLPSGDLDSVGLFQQRPSQGWGTPAQLTDTTYASRLFYGGPSNPNAGRTRGLLDIPGWQGMSLAQAAQSVQLSAFPDAYAKWEPSATAWLAAIG